MSLPQFVRNLPGKDISVNGQIITLTKETLDKTCLSFANGIVQQLVGAMDGTAPVYSLPDFMQHVSDQYLKYLKGTFYPGLWFWQRAYFIQTGKSVSLL
jgi:hypothetical protein